MAKLEIQLISEENQKLIFASIFQIANGLQTYLDKNLKSDNLTAKQFLLMIEIGSLGPEGALLNEIAERSESSRQNVMQIALKLEKNGFVNISKDTVRKRAKRLMLTEKALNYWQNRQGGDQNYLKMLFDTLTPEHLDIVAKAMITLKDNLKKMENQYE